MSLLHIPVYMDSINICNRLDRRYEEYVHHFEISGSPFKLKVIDITRYRNPVYNFFKIRYKMSPSDMNLNESNVINQLRLDEPDYYRQILDRRRG